MTKLQIILKKIDNLQSNMSVSGTQLLKELKVELKQIEIESITYKNK